MTILFHRLSIAALTVGAFIISTPTWAEDSAPRSTHTASHTISVDGGILHPSRHFNDRAAGYFTIHNTGPSDLLLNGITSPTCKTISSNHSNQEIIQNSVSSDDIFQHLAIPHQATMVFPAAGYHLLCLGIQNMPHDGETVPFTFHFLNEGSISTTFTVKTSSPNDVKHD